MINVFIADDHAIVRQGVKQVLSEYPDIKLTGEAADGQEVLRQARTEVWDVLVLDLSLPDCSGLDVLKSLKHEQPNLPVLVLSMHAEDQFALRCLKAGASGYLTKESVPEELVKAIRKAAVGRKYISSNLAETLAFGLQTTADQPRHASLSDREFQVVQRMGAGKTTKEIAEELSLSVKTVSTYRARILEKLDLKTSAAIIHYAVQNGLID